MLAEMDMGQAEQHCTLYIWPAGCTTLYSWLPVWQEFLWTKSRWTYRLPVEVPPSFIIDAKIMAVYFCCDMMCTHSDLLSWTVQSLYTGTVENQAPGWPQERFGEWADSGQWDTSNITCMNRINQSHASKLVTNERTNDELTYRALGSRRSQKLRNVIQAAQSLHHWTPQWWSDTASRDSTVKKKITERNTSPTAF